MHVDIAVMDKMITVIKGDAVQPNADEISAGIIGVMGGCVMMLKIAGAYHGQNAEGLRQE